MIGHAVNSESVKFSQVGNVLLAQLLRNGQRDGLPVISNDLAGGRQVTLQRTDRSSVHRKALDQMPPTGMKRRVIQLCDRPRFSLLEILVHVGKHADRIFPGTNRIPVGCEPVEAINDRAEQGKRQHSGVGFRKIGRRDFSIDSSAKLGFAAERRLPDAKA